MSQCIGRCCQAFSISLQSERDPLVLYTEDPDGFVDGRALADMLIRLPGPTPDGRLRFTCRHLTDELRCGIYEERPDMCRTYPNGGTCGWCGLRYSGDGVAFTENPFGLFVVPGGNGWYQMPDGSKVRGPLGVLGWMRENRVIEDA